MNQCSPREREKNFKKLDRLNRTFSFVPSFFFFCWCVDPFWIRCAWRRIICSSGVWKRATSRTPRNRIRWRNWRCEREKQISRELRNLRFCHTWTSTHFLSIYRNMQDCPTSCTMKSDLLFISFFHICQNLTFSKKVIGNYVSDVSEVLKLWRQQVRRGSVLIEFKSIAHWID